MDIVGAALGRQKTKPPKRADALADLVLHDHEGAEVRLGTLWEDRLAVLVWLRHYGWTYCRGHAVQLDREREAIEEAGASLTFIGQATHRHAAHFRRKQDLGATVLADPERISYQAAGTKVATADELLGPKIALKGIANVLSTRQVQGRPIGNVAQLGGVLVIRPDGKVAWSHLADDASDNAQVADVLAAVRAG